MCAQLKCHNWEEAIHRQGTGRVRIQHFIWKQGRRRTENGGKHFLIHHTIWRVRNQWRWSPNARDWASCWNLKLYENKLQQEQINDPIKKKICQNTWSDKDELESRHLNTLKINNFNENSCEYLKTWTWCDRNKTWQKGRKQSVKANNTNSTILKPRTQNYVNKYIDRYLSIINCFSWHIPKLFCL